MSDNICVILEGFNSVWQKPQFCSWLLDNLDCDILEVGEILAVLTATLPYKDWLSARKGFYIQAKVAIRRECPDNWKRQLEGLE